MLAAGYIASIIWISSIFLKLSSRYSLFKLLQMSLVFCTVFVVLFPLSSQADSETGTWVLVITMRCLAAKLNCFFFSFNFAQG